MELRIGWIAWSIVAGFTVLRAVFAGTLPLTGDEAYYWEWSRRLAGGYVDHPPAVAFAIFAFEWIGRTPFAVRFAFVLCGFGTAVFAYLSAAHLARDRCAGWVAALAVTLAPMLLVAFGIASPDGPFALAWAASLYCAIRAFESFRVSWFALLGIALGAALLSRFFGIALAAGILTAACSRAHRHVLPKTLFSMLVALIVWMPFLSWNAGHAWISFTFALVQRHEVQFQLARPFVLYALCALGYSPGLWIAATLAAVRPRYALLFWTGVPLSVLFFILAFREQVEVYWFIGPFISLSIAIGCAFAEWPAAARTRAAGLIFVPGAVLCALMFVTAAFPSQLYAAVRGTGLRLNSGGPFEIFTYRALAQDVARLTNRRNALAMTDGYGFSSLLDFYGNLSPVLIGYDAQGAEGRLWYTDAGRRENTALFVDKIALSKRPEFAAQLARACAHVKSGPVLRYPLAMGDPAIPPRSYFTTWCEGMRSDALAILRWTPSD